YNIESGFGLVSQMSKVPVEVARDGGLRFKKAERLEEAVSQYADESFPIMTRFHAYEMGDLIGASQGDLAKRIDYNLRCLDFKKRTGGSLRGILFSLDALATISSESQQYEKAREYA